MSLEDNPIFRQARQMERLRSLPESEQLRLQRYMRERGLSFEDAWHRLHQVSPEREVYGVRLVNINLPPPRPARGKRTTRRQRRKG